MKSLLLTLLLALPGWDWLWHIHERNAAVATAQAAHDFGQPEAEVFAWQQAVATAGRPAPALLLNLANAQFRAGQRAAARATYSQLLAASPALGSVARQQLAVLALAQGEAVPALGLLREALRLNPRNATARYNYEVLRDYLARQAPDVANRPARGSPPPPKSTAPDSSASARRPKPRPGTGRPELQTDHNQPGEGPPQPRPAAGNQPSPQAPSPTAGHGSAGRRQPGAGAMLDVPVGERPGTQRGFRPSAETGPDAPDGASARPGTESARLTDLRLQTQRERLRALNLNPAQARQVLEALRMQEQQYLQQLTRPAPEQATPDGPTW